MLHPQRHSVAVVVAFLTFIEIWISCSVLTVTQLMSMLESAGTVDSATVSRVEEFVKSNQFTEGMSKPQPKPKVRHFLLLFVCFFFTYHWLFDCWKVLSYEERASASCHPVCKKLFTIMHRKRTNLVVSADVTSSHELLQVGNIKPPIERLTVELSVWWLYRNTLSVNDGYHRLS